MSGKRVCPHCGLRMFTESPVCSRCGKSMNIVIRKEIDDEETGPLAPPPIDEPSKENSSMTRYNPPPQSMEQFSESSSELDMRKESKIIRPLPSSFARYGPPLVQGEVIDNRQQSVEDKSHQAGEVVKNIIGATMLPFKPAIGIGILVSGLGRPKNYRNEVVFSLEKADKTQVGIRIPKEIRVGQIRMGDILSIWGRDVGGEIVMALAYNHTLGGEIRLA